MKGIILFNVLLFSLYMVSFGVDSIPRTKNDDILYHWVTIPMNNRSDWQTVIDSIVMSSELRDLAYQNNTEHNVRINDEIYMYLPLIEWKGEYLYAYEIKKGDTIADLSYLFYEDYDYYHWKDFNQNLSVSNWEIQTEATLYINIPEKYIIDSYDSTSDVYQKDPTLEDENYYKNNIYWVSVEMEKRGDWQDVIEKILKDSYNSEYLISSTLENNSSRSVKNNEQVLVLMPIENISDEYYYVYEITKGDILSEISYLFYEDYVYDELLNKNLLESADMIESGDELYIPISEDNIIARYDSGSDVTIYESDEQEDVEYNEIDESEPENLTTSDYWVSIDMENRYNWTEVAEKILKNSSNPDLYLQKTLENNDTQSIRDNGYMMVFMPVVYQYGKYFYSYEIEKGDVLSDISYLFYEDFIYKELLTYNELNNPDLIREDEELMIPLFNNKVISHYSGDQKTTVVHETYDVPVLDATSLSNLNAIGNTNIVLIYVTNYITNVVVEILETDDLGLASELEVELIQIPNPVPKNMTVTTNYLK